MESQEHVTAEGFLKILSIKASVNKGLSKELKAIFPEITSVPRPLVEDQEIKDPQ